MKMTLLEMVQNILSALNSDEVNDINDTVEAIQIAEVIKETYHEQFNSIILPSQKTLLKLDGIATVTSPNYLKFNSDVFSIDWIKYRNYRANDTFHEPVRFVTPEEFLEIVLNYNTTSDHVVQTTDPSSGVQYFIKANKKPDYYTSFDNNYIAFDSYDSDFEDTLHANNVIAYGTKTVDFLMENDYVPEISDNLFPLLLAEAKSTCFLNQKQIASTKEEQRAHRQRIRMQNDQYKSKEQQRRKFTSDRNYARPTR